MAQTCPQRMFLIFLKGLGLDFPSSSQIIPINILLLSSSSQKIPIKFSSIFFLFPSGSYQNPFVPMAMQDRQVSTKVNGETRESLRQSAKWSAGVRGQEGEPKEEAWQADVCRVRQSRKSGFSACQVLWKSAGRSASRAAVCHASSLMCEI